MSLSYDAVVLGGGIVGAACARAFAGEGMKVALIERDVIGGGATAAGMGHIVAMDDSPAQFALTRYSQQLWSSLASALPAAAEYEPCGTLWVACDEEEMAQVLAKQTYYAEHGVPVDVLDATAVTSAEPNLRKDMAGALLVPEDAVVYPPVVAAWLVQDAQRMGADVYAGKSIIEARQGRVTFEDGTTIRSPRIVNAAGAAATELAPELKIKKRKGHLAITDRYPGFVRHQIVELGYLKSAHSVVSDSVAFNVQPRKTGQILIGSSRQYDNEESAVDHAILQAMLKRAQFYLPQLNELSAIRVWTGFRAATPDKLPLIGPSVSDDTVFLATGHEGLGITTSLATAQLLADYFSGCESVIAIDPYLPQRFAQEAAHA